MVGVVAAEPVTGACEAWDIDFGMFDFWKVRRVTNGNPPSLLNIF